MPGSKLWKKNRWFWYCGYNNNASSWKDHYECRAMSRLTYPTEQEAKDAGRKHKHQPVHFMQIK